MKIRRLRTAAAVVAGLLALGLAGLLLSAQWGVAAEYGYGQGTGLYMFALLPVLAGVVAVSLAGWGRRTGLALLALTVLTVGGIPLAGAAGERAKEARSEQADARFTCNGPNAEVLVPDAVDGAWHQVEHPAPYWLYGPVEGTRSGCTAAISGDPDASFEAWRRSLLGSGWEVVSDGRQVEVREGDVSLVLRRDGDLVSLTAAAGATACEPGAGLADGMVQPC